MCVTASLRRCFALIDSSTLEQTRDETETDAQTHMESLVELGLSSTVSTVLTQCSTDIYQVPVHTHLLRCAHTHTHLGLLDVSLCRWPCRRSTPSPPPASSRRVCPAGWWLTCAEQQPRWVLIAMVMSPSHAHPVASRLQCHPAEALRLFLPHCCSVISRITHSQYRRHRE